MLPRLIATIRRTGGFNSDWDTSYALTLFSLGRPGGLEGEAELASETRLTALENIVEEFGSAPRERGAMAVDTFLDVEVPLACRHGSTRRASTSAILGMAPDEQAGDASSTRSTSEAPLFKKLHGGPPRGTRAGRDSSSSSAS